LSVKKQLKLGCPRTTMTIHQTVTFKLRAMRGLGGYSIAFDIYATREAEILSSNAAIRRAWMAMS